MSGGSWKIRIKDKRIKHTIKIKMSVRNNDLRLNKSLLKGNFGLNIV
jgi:hypothetical protein